jgi:hypothetical protein
MPQVVDNRKTSVNPQGLPVFLKADASGSLRVASGRSSLLAISGPTVVKTGPGRLVRIMVLGTAASGSLTINDCASLAAATTANQVVSIPSTAVKPIITLDVPCTAGIVISAIPVGVTLSAVFT